MSFRRFVRTFRLFLALGAKLTSAILRSVVSPIPSDLRKLKKPVHTRLPPASAGQPGNDVADVEIIREDWMRRKVLEEVLSRCEERARLKYAAHSILEELEPDSDATCNLTESALGRSTSMAIFRRKIFRIGSAAMLSGRHSSPH